VARGNADVLDVVRADALLGGGRARVRARRLAQEDALELQHPRDRQQHGRIVRDERRARQPHVAAPLVEGQKALAYLGAPQRRGRRLPGRLGRVLARVCAACAGR